MARLEKKSIEDAKKAEKAAVENFKRKLIEERQKYPRPTFLPDDEIPTIGFFGEMGTGKSSMLNAIVGKKNFRSGTGETTKTVQVYRWGDFRIVDLPGACSENFAANEYFQEFGIRYFDTVVWLSSDATVKELGLEAVKHLTDNHVPTLFVQSKVDSVIDGEILFNGRSELQVLEEMKEKFNEMLSKYDCPVYLVSTTSVLRECGSLQAAGQGKRLHQRINRDWHNFVDTMKRSAIERKSLLS